MTQSWPWIKFIFDRKIQQFFKKIGPSPVQIHVADKSPISSILYIQHLPKPLPNSGCYWPCRNPCLFDVELATRSRNGWAQFDDLFRWTRFLLIWLCARGIGGKWLFEGNSRDTRGIVSDFVRALKMWKWPECLDESVVHSYIHNHFDELLLKAIFQFNTGIVKNNQK
jgi:hypothetical protein